MKLNKYLASIVIVSTLIISSSSYSMGVNDKETSKPVSQTVNNSVPSKNDSQDQASLDFKNTSKVVVELETAQILKAKLEIYRQTTVELAKQVELYKQAVILEEDKYKTCETLISKNEELYKQKEEALQRELTEAKKTRWGSLFSSGGLGAALGIAAVIALHI